MHSISDLTTVCRRTTGDVPAKLVGASTTVIGSKLYLFGGRLVTARRMVADLYVFDLELFKWDKIQPFPEDEVPCARYFHSADSWNNQLIIFGGMGNKTDTDNPDDLRVLNDVRFFNISTGRWVPTTTNVDYTPDSLVPKPRYAHLSSVTANRLFIIGGQDLSNVWQDDIYVYDLLAKTWVQKKNCSRHCGTYRSIAVSSDKRIRFPQEERRTAPPPSKLGPPGNRFKQSKLSPSSPSYTSSESLVHLPYSSEPTDEYPCNIYLYSNYNFTDVKRELEVLSPRPGNDFAVEDHSSAMGGTSFPPGLRFPTGAVLGTHLIVAGTYLAHSYQSFSIWTLDLITMTWSRLDAGSVVSSGSWFRGCLWADSNKFLVFGNRNGNLVDDYNRRVLSWDHVAVVDLEAFGIYRAPPLKLDIQMQELGLAALEEDLFTDFEIICDDGRKVRCSREVLEDRWPWFREQRMKLLRKANTSLESLPVSPMHIPLTNLPISFTTQDDQVDPRLTPRSFRLSEPFPITLALLQYFYSLSLITPLQHAPAVLSQLLVLSNNYQIKHLEVLVKHAMHRALSNATAVGVYEVATLCKSRGLQLRALKAVLSFSQKRPTGRPRRDTDGNGIIASHEGGIGMGNRRPEGVMMDNMPMDRPRAHSDPRLRATPEPHMGYSGANRPRTAPRPQSRVGEASSNDSAYYSYYPSQPPPVVQRRRARPHEKSGSAVSTATDREIRSVAEFLSPIVMDGNNYIAEEHEENVNAIDDEYDSIMSPMQNLSIEIPDMMKRGRMYNDRSYIHSPLSPHSQPTSDSDPDAWSDDQLDRDRLSEISYPSYHMPSRQRPLYYGTDGSDTPSLTSSASYSSLASGSRSTRQHGYSPDDSPILLPASIREALAAPHLAIVDEQEDDYGIDHRRFDSNGSATTFTQGQAVKDHRGGLYGERVLLTRTHTGDTVTGNHPSSLGSSSPEIQYVTRSHHELPMAGGVQGINVVYPYSNRPSTSAANIVPAASNEFSRYGGRGMRRVKAKTPKDPKDKPSIQKITERLWKDNQSEHKTQSKKAQKAEAKKRKKEMAREQNTQHSGEVTVDTQSL